MTENTPESAPANDDVQPSEPDTTQPGSPTAEEIAADKNLWAPAEAGDDTGVDEHGDDLPDEA